MSYSIRQAMLEFDKGIYTFLTSYVVVIGYLDHAAKKLRSLAENCEKVRETDSSLIT